ncbi:MAG: YndJ family transporter [Pirellulaceae bacterium]|nr:YndJ family transporter [Pirellulaceae bacterium]
MTSDRMLLGLVAAIWLAAWVGLALPLEVAIWLFAPLVLVRRGIELARQCDGSPRERILLATANHVQLPAATILAVSFALPRGKAAATLAIPWLFVTLLLAATGLGRLVRCGLRIDAKLAISASLVLVAVGGGWGVLSRLGSRPQNFSDEIVLLTAIHFHYAGFVLPLLAGLSVRRRVKPRPIPPSLAERAVLLGVVLGVPAVGLGISLSPHLEVVSAVILAIACIVVAVQQLLRAAESREATRLALAGVAAAALVAGMSLAAAYAVGEFWGARWLDIPTMIRTHGVCNAFGFAACGLAVARVQCEQSSSPCAPSSFSS